MEVNDPRRSDGYAVCIENVFNIKKDLLKVMDKWQSSYRPPKNLQFDFIFDNPQPGFHPQLLLALLLQHHLYISSLKTKGYYKLFVL